MNPCYILILFSSIEVAS